MDRRGFLKSILAAAVAPAIVKATNLMKVVPISDTGIVGLDQALYTGEIGSLDRFSFSSSDYLSPTEYAPLVDQENFTLSMWAKSPKLPDTSRWYNITQTHSEGLTKFYIDSKEVSEKEFAPFSGVANQWNPAANLAASNFFEGEIADVSIQNLVAAPKAVKQPLLIKQVRSIQSEVPVKPPVAQLDLLNDSADQMLGKFQKAFLGRAFQDINKLQQATLGRVIQDLEQVQCNINDTLDRVAQPIRLQG